MALVRCKECGAQVSTKADACPKCGAKRKTDSGNPVAFGCMATLFIVGVVWFIGSIGGSGKSTSGTTPSKEDPGQSAYYTSKAVVQEMLKAPSTAKFSNPYTDSETGWSKVGDDEYRCWGYVDSQNSFGAMLRSTWITQVKRSGTGWLPVYFKFGDEVVMDARPKE